MATFFEIRIAHEDGDYARQAAQSAFQIVGILDKLLNRYRDDSEISQIRALNPGESLRLNPLTFECLQLAFKLEKITGGAFSPSLGAQVDVYREVHNKETKAIPPIPLQQNALIFDPTSYSVVVTETGLALDLGAIGKGFAIDQMAAELKNWEIERALIVAGDSTILAMESPSADSPGWTICLSKSVEITLRNGSISSSGSTVKGGHIIDPLTGNPATGPYRTWALHPCSAVSDALSTAWMLLSEEEIKEVCAALPSTRAFLQNGADTEPSEINF